MRVLILLLTLVFIGASAFLVVKSSDKCSRVYVKPVTKIVKVGFKPMNGKETVSVADVLKGLGLSNGIEFNISTNENTIYLNAPVNQINNPDGIIPFLKEIEKLPFLVLIERLELSQNGLSLKTKVFKRGV